MTPPSPFLATSLRQSEDARRHRRKRTTTLAVLATALVAAALVILALAATPTTSGPRSVRAAATPATSGRVSSSLPLADAPVNESLGPVPLAVKVADPNDPVRIHLGRSPRSGLLFDLDTGRVLWRRAPDRILPIASLTKMMTALVVVNSEPPDARVLITKQAVNFAGSGVGNLPLHHHVRLEPLLNGLLLPSGNDAAIALAQRVAGTQRAFVDRMNARAAAMNLGCTHYTSPSGLLDAGNHSCAIDLAAEARAILDSPRLARIVRRHHYRVRFPIKGGRLDLANNNPLLEADYPGTVGIKTGYTARAGLCLVAAVQRDGHRLGLVLLHTPDWLNQARRIFDAGFAFERTHPAG